MDMQEQNTPTVTPGDLIRLVRKRLEAAEERMDKGYFDAETGKLLAEAYGWLNHILKRNQNGSR